jgi:hypothetical protein
MKPVMATKAPHARTFVLAFAARIENTDFEYPPRRMSKLQAHAAWAADDHALRGASTVGKRRIPTGQVRLRQQRQTGVVTTRHEAETSATSWRRSFNEPLEKAELLAYTLLSFVRLRPG